MCAAASLDLTNPPEMKQQENFLAVNFLLKSQIRGGIS